MIFFEILLQIVIYIIIITTTIIILSHTKVINKRVVKTFTVLGQFTIIFGIGSYVINYYINLKTEHKEITSDLIKLNDSFENINKFLLNHRDKIPDLVYEFYNQRGSYFINTYSLTPAPKNYNQNRKINLLEVMCIEYIINQFYKIWTLLIGNEVSLEYKKHWDENYSRTIDINKIYKKISNKNYTVTFNYNDLGIIQDKKNN